MALILILLTASLFTGSTEDAQSNYCQDAPECYMQPLEFGNNIQLPDNKWSTYPQISDHSLDQIEKLRYAYQISQDKDFVLTLKAENGTIDPTRRSDIIGANGHWDHGICQLNYQWHQPFIDSPNFKDWRKQIDYCLEVFNKRNGAFYGFYNRHKVAKYFIF